MVILDIREEALTEPAKSEAESPTKHTGGSVIAEPWEPIFPPHIFQVLLSMDITTSGPTAMKFWRITADEPGM
jgi:hypothetical protein